MAWVVMMLVCLDDDIARRASGQLLCGRPQVHRPFGILERVKDQGAAAQVNDAGVAERRAALDGDGGIDALGKLV